MVLSVTSQRVSAFAPRRSLMAMATRKGVIAVTTRTCGLKSSKMVAGTVIRKFSFPARAAESYRRLSSGWGVIAVTVGDNSQKELMDFVEQLKSSVDIV